MAHLLLVSPDVEARLTIEPALYADGHVVRVADNGGDAIDLLGDMHFDAVLCEKQLPDMKSRALIRHIKDVYGIPTIPFGSEYSLRRSWLSPHPEERAKRIDGHDLAKLVERAL